MKTISPTIMAFFIFSMLCLFLLSVHASAFEDSVTKTRNLPPVADAYINSGYPDKNYGEYPSLWVKGNRYNKSIFIKFNLLQIPADATIVSAQLMLYGPSSNRGSISVYYVPDDSWTECGITYNNRPSSSIYLTDKENVSSKSWCSWNIKEDVITAFSDNKILTAVMRYENEEDYEGAWFFPREFYREDIRPKLEITYTIPTSPTPTPSVAPTPTLPSTSTPWWKDELSWIIITAVATIMLVILALRSTRKDRKKPRY